MSNHGMVLIKNEMRKMSFEIINNFGETNANLTSAQLWKLYLSIPGNDKKKIKQQTNPFLKMPEMWPIVHMICLIEYKRSNKVEAQALND